MAKVSQGSDSPDPAIARVGRAVTARRLELGMATQRELAEKAGVALNTAAFLERGHTFPRQGNLRKIEIALQWPPGTLQTMLRGEVTPADVGHPTRNGARAAGGIAPRDRFGGGSTSANVHMIAIASAVATIATKSITILRRAAATDPDAGQTLRELDAELLRLETILSASIPDASADALDETLSAVADVHRQREAIKDAVTPATSDKTPLK